MRIASWNVEYLMTPATHLALRNNCAENGGMVGGDDRTLPCAITNREPRTADDYVSLRNYATQLRADIVALQEVDGPEAATQVFLGYDFCFSTRAHTRKWLRDSPRPAASMRARIRATISQQCRTPRRGGHLLPRHGE